MDDYPAELAPHQIGFEREPFSLWWERVRERYPTIPKNVARQWLHRHWQGSRYRFLPSASADFRLEHWTKEQFLQMQSWRMPPAKMLKEGRHMLSLERRRRTPSPVANIMERRGTWPAPIIAMEHDGRFLEQMPDLPLGVVLIEGNRRSEMAHALAEDGKLGDRLPVWVLSYGPRA